MIFINGQVLSAFFTPPIKFINIKINKCGKRTIPANRTINPLINLFIFNLLIFSTFV